MSRSEDHFKDIDFGKEWDEADWEWFFDAQEKFKKGTLLRSFSRDRRRASPELSFRYVMRRFGMDPDNSPSEFKSAAGEPGVSRALEYWQEGAEADSLPIYLQARYFDQQLQMIVEREFGAMITKPYKSLSFRRFQNLLKDFLFHAGQVPQALAAAHELGYAAEGVKGNIVRCRKALEHADACLGLMNKFPPRRLPPEDYRRLFRESARLRNDLALWVEDLRRRFIPGRLSH